jgi:tetratricopeptide (TPR) repeat protein
LQLSLERPLFGWGPYSFRFIQPRLQTSVFATSDHPHNVFLKLAMERGWPAAILFALLILGILFATAWREMKQRTSLLPAAMVDDDADLCLPVFLALSGVLLHSMIDYNLQFVAIAVPFWLLLGFLAARMSRIPAIGREPTVIRVTEIGLIALLLCMLLFEGRYLVLSSLGRKAETSQAPDQALHWYTLARGELFSRDLHLSRASLLAEQDDLQGASSAIADYMLQNREDARAWKLLGDIQYRQESYAKALASYDRAFVLGKYNYLGILTGTLQTLLAHPDPAQNAARKQETDTILHAFASAVMQDAHFIDLSTNIEEFSTAASLAAKLYPAEMQSYHLLKTQVMEKATAERARLGNQRQGMLW